MMIRRKFPPVKLDPQVYKLFHIRWLFGYIERWGIIHTEDEAEQLRRLKIKFARKNDLSDQDVKLLESITFVGDRKCNPHWRTAF
jgi:hypothetical protein